VIAGYEKYADPSGNAEKHASAQRQLEMLRDDFGAFASVRAKGTPRKEAEHLFDYMEKERTRLESAIISVEPAAHHALDRR
jgi:hypothetical protein